MVIRRDWRKSLNVGSVTQESTVGMNMPQITLVTVHLGTGVLMASTGLIPLGTTLQHTMPVQITLVHILMAEKQAMEVYVQLVTSVLKDHKHHSLVHQELMDIFPSLPSV